MPVLVGALSVVAACGGATAPPSPDLATSAPPTTTAVGPSTSTPTSTSTSTSSTVVEGRSRVARPVADTPVFADPTGTDEVMVLPARSEFGSALALVVVDESVDGWLHVQLPTRPNESTGWIRSAGTEVRDVDLGVHIDLSGRRLTVIDGDEVVIDTEVAVGAGATPTPTGTFFVTDKLVTENANSPYGPYALGLSAHSEVLTEFAGGDGQVGIHGTNQPASIGQDVSNGCVRVPNEVAVALNDLLPLGTPVTVS